MLAICPACSIVIGGSKEGAGIHTCCVHSFVTSSNATQ